jgi:hypothetical protein
MRRANLFAVAFGATGVFVLALAGNGQERLGLAGPGESLRLALLKSPEVQKSLELKAKQIEDIGRIRDQTKEARKQVEGVHGKGKEKGKAKGDDPVAKEQERIVREAMNGELAEVERQTDRQINTVLDTRQQTRLTQIVLRVEGPSAFLTDELIDALGITPDQVEGIREILNGMRDEQDQYKESQKQSFELAKASGDFELEKIRKDRRKAQSRAYTYRLSKQVMAQIARVLTRRQRDKYNKMLGEAFDLARLTGPDGQPLLDESADLSGWLLWQPAVQDELKLTASQRERLGKGQPAAKVLDSGQQVRLRQIALQSEGAAALVRPEVTSALRLDDGQLEQIQAVLGELIGAHRELRESVKAAAEEFDDDNPALKAARKEQEKTQMRVGARGIHERATQQVSAGLTRRQRDELARILGKPFDFGKVRVPPPPER